MSNELILTKEILNEFLDPQLSKFYEYKVEDKLPANCKFQASFEDEHGKQYFFSFFRENSLGKNSRKVVLSVKKNKNTTFKINIDKGSFLRMLGTLVRVYEEYKVTEDGLKCTSFGFYFPDTFTKYAPFIVRLISRMWKTEPKKRLALYGAAESFQASLVLLYVNVNSMVPYFGGPLTTSDEASTLFFGQFYEELSGIHKTSIEKANAAQLNKAASAIANQGSGLSAMAKKKAEEKPEAALKNVPIPEPVQKAMPAVNAHPENPEAGQDGWVLPFKDDGYNYGGIEATHIRMKVDSGSSSLKKGQEAEIYGAYMNNVFKNCYVQFGLTEKAAKIAMKGGNGVLIVKPNSNPSKYVALNLNSLTVNINNSFWYLDANNKSPEDIEKKSEITNTDKVKPSVIKIATNPQAKSIKELPLDYIESIQEGIKNFEIGPIKIDIAGSSIFDLTERIQEIQQMLGKMDPTLVAKNCENFIYKAARKNAELNDIFNKYAKDNGLFLEYSPKTKAVTDYTGSDYREINDYLRDKAIPSYADNSVVKVKVSKIDQNFTESGIRLPKQLKVYRGASISASDIELLNKLENIPLTGYASVSLNVQTALQFGGMGVISTTQLIRGQLIAFDSDNKDKLDDYSFDSRQGNKILYSIDRLDRCLSLMLREISNYASEEEILLNRGTNVQLKKNEKVYKVMNRMDNGTHITYNDGIWFARTEISENSLKEKNLRDYLFSEAIQNTTNAMDNLAILYTCINDIKQSAQSR